MRNFENHKLPNLSLLRKSVYSLCLFLGICFLIFTRFSVKHFLELWGFLYNRSASWGDLMGFLAWDRIGIFLLLVGLHVIGIAISLFVFDKLVTLSGVQSRTRKLISIFGNFLVAFDLLGWLVVALFVPLRGVAELSSAVSAVVLSCFCAFPLWKMWVYRRWKGTGGEPVRVVVVGGGYAGMRAAWRIDKELGYHRDISVTLVSKDTVSCVSPLLVSAAFGVIPLEQSVVSLRRAFETTNVELIKGNVLTVDARTNKVLLEVEAPQLEDDEPQLLLKQVPYDLLVIASGTEPKTQGVSGIEHAFFLKNHADAMALRNHVLDCFERAANADSEEHLRELLCFVVVGAGPLGIEVVGQLHDLIFVTLVKRYPQIDESLIQLWLVEESHEFLQGFPQSVVNSAMQSLKKMRVGILAGARIVGVANDGVTLVDGRRQFTRTCIWCGGTKGGTLLRTLKKELDSSGRLPVDIDLRVPSLANVFCIGEAAHVVDGRTGWVLPGRTELACAQAEHAAKNIVRMLYGMRPVAFHYNLNQSVLSLGMQRAVATWNGLLLRGFLGWVAWFWHVVNQLVRRGDRVQLFWTGLVSYFIERGVPTLKHDESIRQKNKRKVA